MAGRQQSPDGFRFAGKRTGKPLLRVSKGKIFFFGNFSGPGDITLMQDCFGAKQEQRR